MLMSPNEDETAVHGDMAVRMRTVLAAELVVRANLLKIGS